MHATPQPDGTVAPLDRSLPGWARGLGLRGVRSQVSAARPVIALHRRTANRRVVAIEGRRQGRRGGPITLKSVSASWSSCQTLNGPRP